MASQSRLGSVEAVRAWALSVCDQLEAGTADYGQADIDELVGASAAAPLTETSVLMFTELVRVVRARGSSKFCELTIPIPPDASARLHRSPLLPVQFSEVLAMIRYPESLRGIRVPGFSIDRARPRLPAPLGVSVTHSLGTVALAADVMIDAELTLRQDDEVEREAVLSLFSTEPIGEVREAQVDLPSLPARSGYLGRLRRARDDA